MRAIPIALLCAAAAACRTSSLGACSSDGDCASGATCDSVARVCVSSAGPDGGGFPDAPLITNVTISTPAGYTSPDGSAFFDTAGAPLAVAANVSGPAGVTAGSVCLKVAGESGTCPHPGTQGSGTAYSFELPRGPSSSDGTTPLDFTITASSPSGHVGTSAVRHVFFDGQPPSVTVAADNTAYARLLPDGGATPIDVSVTIVDPTGAAAPQLLSGTTAIAPSSSSGNVYVFPLDPRAAPAGAEGAYMFHVRAVDHFGHDGGADGTRVIDGAPPAVTVQIFKDVPDGGGVTYPAAVANTGWTGATFVYSDTVHVQGTITDVSGVGSATLHVDGIGLDGGVSLGTVRSLGCTAGTSSCPFSLDVTLNDAGSELHTGTATFDAGSAVGNVPAGMLRFTIDAKDNAVAFGGAPAGNPASSVSQARTTRLLWQNTLAGTAVSGMAVHPNGDVIVTMADGTGDTVYSLAPDQPSKHWGRTLDLTFSSDGVFGTPAIGAGDASSARIYVGAEIGDFYAFNPDGGTAWDTQTTSFLFAVGPAVTQVTVGSGQGDAVVVPDGVDGGNSNLWLATEQSLSAVASDNRDFFAAPLILNGNVYFATQNSTGTTTHLTQHSISATGALGTPTTSNTNGGTPYFGLITDGTNLYAARPSIGINALIKISPSFTPGTAPLWTSGVTTGPSAGEPTFGIDGRLYTSSSTIVSSFSASTGTSTLFVTLSGGRTPLQGSDGHVYIPVSASSFNAYEGNLLSWTFSAPTAVLRQVTMDCQGRVFVAHGATVSAFISDDRGMADTPWPSLRRDARNTGNASTGWPKYGILTASGCTQ